MPDYTPHQKRIIDRYYDHRDDILVHRLSEIVTEMVLSESDKKTEQLWKRAEKTLRGLKTAEAVIQRLVTGRNPDALARFLRGLLDQSGKK